MRTSFFQLYTFFTIPRPFSRAVKRFLRSSVRLLAGPFPGIQRRWSSRKDECSWSRPASMLRARRRVETGWPFCPDLTAIRSQRRFSASSRSLAICLRCSHERRSFRTRRGTFRATSMPTIHHVAYQRRVATHSTEFIESQDCKPVCISSGGLPACSDIDSLRSCSVEGAACTSGKERNHTSKMPQRIRSCGKSDYLQRGQSGCGKV